MKKNILFFFVFFLTSGFVLADDYPKNHNIDILHYSFSLTLSDQSNVIEGKTIVTLSFKKDSLEVMRLDLTNKSEDFEGKGMVVESVYSDGKELAFHHKKDALFIYFPRSSEKGTIIQIAVNYHGIPASGLKIGPTKYGNRSFFSRNWPNKARHWLPVINHPYEKATCEFKITAPAHYQVVSNGLLKEETNLAGGKKFTHWKQSVPIPSWLYVLGAAEFAVQYVGEFRGKSIQTWVYPQNRKAGFNDLAEPVEHTLEFFSEYVGPFVYEKLASIQSTSTNTAGEYATAVLYNEDAITGNQTPWLHNAIIHEVAHHWFGNAVTESTWDDAWLSEGFATYFTMLFREHAYGRKDLLSELNKAKNKIFDYYKDNPGYKIISDRSPETESVTSLATYQKGAWILHMLRNFVGDHAFKKGIQSYYSRYKNSIASTSDFRFEMEKASGKNLKKFFYQWLYQGGNPKLEGSWWYDKSKKIVKVKLEQVQAEEFQFDLPVEIGIYQKNQIKPAVEAYRMDQRSTELIIPVTKEPEKVVIDPDTKLLAKWEFSRK